MPLYFDSLRTKNIQKYDRNHQNYDERSIFINTFVFVTLENYSLKLVGY
jgi:hypothetical protein